MPLIELKEVKKIYQSGEASTVALNGVSLSIKEGEFVAIMGPSGSGKSTLLHILGLLDKPTFGEYFYQGKLVSNLSENKLAQIRNKEMGFVFQAFYLLPRLKVVENVKLPLLYSDIPYKRWEKLALESLEKVGILQRKDYLAFHLSGGEKQRVAIARALVQNPKIIFADEPTGNLDSKSGRQVMDILSKLHEQGKTIILVTHENFAAAYAQRIIQIKDGKIISDSQKS